VIPGQQNAPHQLIIHPAMAAQHAAVTAAAQAAGNQGQPQSGGPGAPQWGGQYYVGEESHNYNNQIFNVQDPHHQTNNNDQQQHHLLQYPHPHFQPQQQHFMHYQPQQPLPFHLQTVPCLSVPQRTESPSPSKMLGRGGIQRPGRNDSLRRSIGEKNNNSNTNITTSVKRPDSTTPTNKTASGRPNNKNPRTGFGGFGTSNTDSTGSLNGNSGNGFGKKKLFVASNRGHQRN